MLLTQTIGVWVKTLSANKLLFKMKITLKNTNHKDMQLAFSPENKSTCAYWTKTLSKGNLLWLKELMIHCFQKLWTRENNLHDKIKICMRFSSFFTSIVLACFLLHCTVKQHAKKSLKSGQLTSISFGHPRKHINSQKDADRYLPGLFNVDTYLSLLSYLHAFETCVA